MKAKAPTSTTPERAIRLAPLSVSADENDLIRRGASALGVKIAHFLREAAVAYAKQAIEKARKAAR